jgi:hypothetical protein
MGVEGPILFDLAYLPRFFGEDVRRSAVPIDELPEKPYARLGTHMGIEDDDVNDDDT